MIRDNIDLFAFDWAHVGSIDSWLLGLNVHLFQVPQD